MPVSFNEIPSTIRTPGVYLEIDPTRASGGIGLFRFTSVVVGQRLAAGAVAAGVPTTVFSAAQAAGAFGVGSQLARMVAAFRKVHPTGTLVAVALDDLAGGVQAVGTITVSGAPTGGAPIPLYVGGERILVPATGTADQIAASIVAEITARPDLPVTAAVNPGTPEEVIVTARHKGESGNGIDLRAAHLAGEEVPAGIGLTFSPMDGGTGNPDILTALTALASTDVDVVIHPYYDAANLGTLEAELTDRATALRALPAWAVTGASASAGVLAALGDARNSEFSTLVGLESFPGIPEERAAAVGARVALHGEADPARPFQTLGLPGYAPAVDDQWGLSERETLLADGISTTRANKAGEVSIGRLITTYQETAQGVPDESFLDVNTTLTLKLIRRSYEARIESKFPRHKAAGDDVVPGIGAALLTPSVLKAESDTWYQELIAAGICEDLAGFQANSLYERDGNDPNRFNVVLAPNLVNQARVFAVSVQFRR